MSKKGQESFILNSRNSSSLTNYEAVIAAKHNITGMAVFVTNASAVDIF
jgi:hypothetical protein